MPIRPENRALYPAEWKAISARIRFERAKGRCEMRIDRKRCTARHGKPHPVTGAKVVLTTMHLDHDPTNCADENLLAACQKCHNAYDAKTRAAGIRERRRLASGQMEMAL
jgi:hypothetical protein